MSGKGQLPAIHFSLPEEGSYVENKQGVKLTQENEIENVIEINPIGIGIKVLFNLWVLNPTQACFIFSFHSFFLVDQSESSDLKHQKTLHNWTLQFVADNREEYSVCKNFRTLTPRGTLEPGRKQLLQFEFYSDSSQMVQSQWRFSTETVEINLNLIGQAKDPDILLDSTHISFNNLIARHRGRQVG